MAQVVYSISNFITPAWYLAWDYMRRQLFDEYWYTGGRGTGKSTIAARRITDDIIHDPNANWVCYKKHAVEIETTCYAECVKAINRAGLQPFFKCITSPYEITYLPTGQKIFFRGLDSAGKSKGITATVGYIKGGWFEETDQFTSQAEIDTVLQSIGRGGPYFQLIYTYNPPISKAHWINVEAGKFNPHRFKLHTTYKDWNPAWLGSFFFHKMEAIRAQSEDRYKHEYLGIPVGTGNEIFRNVHAVRFTPEQIAEMRSKRTGMDFGASDPTTIVQTNYIPHWVTDDHGHEEDVGGVLQIYSAWGKSGALNRETYAELERRDLLRAQIYGDPGGGGKLVINEMRDLGVRGLVQAYKPGGSVEKGINFFRACSRIEIDSVEAPGALVEFQQYQFDKMRDGTNRNEFPDKDNHYIDGARYSRQDDIFRNGGSRLLI